MGNREKDLDTFLGEYPYLAQWVNECICCHRKGYKPEMPEPEFDNWVVTTARLRRLADELDLDEGGLCQQCREASLLARG
jgi:hypothetical protein